MGLTFATQLFQAMAATHLEILELQGTTMDNNVTLEQLNAPTDLEALRCAKSDLTYVTLAWHGPNGTQDGFVYGAASNEWLERNIEELTLGRKASRKKNFTGETGTANRTTFLSPGEGYDYLNRTSLEGLPVENNGWSISGPGVCSAADPLGQMCHLCHNGERICLLQECGEIDYSARYIEETHEDEELMIRVKLDEGV